MQTKKLKRSRKYFKKYSRKTRKNNRKTRKYNRKTRKYSVRTRRNNRKRQQYHGGMDGGHAGGAVGADADVGLPTLHDRLRFPAPGGIETNLMDKLSFFDTALDKIKTRTGVYMNLVETLGDHHGRTLRRTKLLLLMTGIEKTVSWEQKHDTRRQAITQDFFMNIFWRDGGPKYLYCSGDVDDTVAAEGDTVKTYNPGKVYSYSRRERSLSEKVKSSNSHFLYEVELAREGPREKRRILLDVDYTTKYKTHGGSFICQILSRQIDNDASELLLRESELYAKTEGRKSGRRLWRKGKGDPRDIRAVPTGFTAIVDYAILPIRCLDVTGTPEIEFSSGFELKPDDEKSYDGRKVVLASTGMLVCERLEYNRQYYYKQSLWYKKKGATVKEQLRIDWGFDRIIGESRLWETGIKDVVEDPDGTIGGKGGKSIAWGFSELIDEYYRLYYIVMKQIKGTGNDILMEPDTKGLHDITKLHKMVYPEGRGGAFDVGRLMMAAKGVDTSHDMFAGMTSLVSSGHEAGGGETSMFGDTSLVSSGHEAGGGETSMFGDTRTPGGVSPKAVKAAQKKRKKSAKAYAGQLETGELNSALLAKDGLAATTARDAAVSRPTAEEAVPPDDEKIFAGVADDTASTTSSATPAPAPAPLALAPAPAPSDLTDDGEDYDSVDV